MFNANKPDRIVLVNYMISGSSLATTGGTRLSHAMDDD